MKTIFSINLILLLCWAVTGNSQSIDEEKIKTLTELMVVGCSLGKSINVDVSASGGITFITRGAKGEFKASKDEIPSIITFLSSDEAREGQADNTRECMKRYMDKIFAVALDEEPAPSEGIKSKSLDGVLYKLNSCSIVDRNNLTCDFQIISAYQDRNIDIESVIYDDSGNEYKLSNVSIASHSANNQIYNVPLIADITMKMTLLYKNISNQAKMIAKMSISTETTLNGRDKNGSLVFRNIKIKK